MPTCTWFGRTSFGAGLAGIACSVLACLSILAGSVDPAFGKSPRVKTRWYRVETERFKLYSSLRKAESLAIAQEMQRLETVLTHLFREPIRTGGTPTHVFVFGRKGTFRPHHFGTSSDDSTELAGFCASTPFANFIAVDAAPGTDRGRVVRHEYTHLHLNQSRGEVALWLDEGFAEYLSTLRVEGGRLLVGEPVSHHLTSLRHNDWIPLDSLLAMTPNAGGFGTAHRSGKFHAQSWLLLHYLLHDAGGRPWSPERLLELDVVPDGKTLLGELGWDSEKLEAKLRAYAGRSVFETAALPAAPRREPGEVHRVAWAPMLTRLGELNAFVHGDTDLARQLFLKALELDPDRPGPNAGLGYVYELEGRHEEAEALFTRALNRRPDVARIALMRGYALLDRFERQAGSVFIPEDEPDPLILQSRAEFERSLDVEPDLAEGHAGLGATYLYDTGDPARGIAALEHARTLLPRRMDLAAQLSLLYAHAGNIQASRAMMELVERGTRDRALVETTHRLLILADRERIAELIEQGRSSEAESALRALLAGVTDPRARANLEAGLAELRRVTDAN